MVLPASITAFLVPFFNFTIEFSIVSSAAFNFITFFRTMERAVKRFGMYIEG